MAQRIKDVALSRQQLGLLLWHGFDPWPRELLHVTGMAGKKKKMTRKGSGCGCRLVVVAQSMKARDATYSTLKNGHKLWPGQPSIFLAVP